MPARPPHPPTDDADPTDAPLGPTPEALALTGRAVAAVRAFLSRRGLDGWAVYLLPGDPLYDLHRHLDALGEGGGEGGDDGGEKFRPTGPAMAAAEGFATLADDGEPDAAGAGPVDHPAGFRVHPDGTVTDRTAEPITDAGDTGDDGAAPDADPSRPTGAIHLRRHGVVAAHWVWVDPAEGGARSVALAAAESPAHLARLRSTLAGLRRRAGASVWQVVSGMPWRDGPRRRRDPRAGDGLILSDELRDKVDREVVRFFDPAVAALHADLGVPHRRGVLLHGPPGNGKTSLIRLAGARLPDVPFLLLRPAADFDGDDLQTVIERWTEQAPAVLVIEDLNWLLKAVNVSTFLNLLDGVETFADRARGGPTGTGPADAPASPASPAPTGRRAGLLLIATTNHPGDLDPAINNRPGRFDVVIEIAHPAEEQRRAFLDRHLPAFDDALREDLARRSDGLSFAHLQEVLRQSGLLALAASRPARTADDLRSAMTAVLATRDEAVRGFPGPVEVPFGLARPRRRR